MNFPRTSFDLVKIVAKKHISFFFKKIRRVRGNKSCNNLINNYTLLILHKSTYVRELLRA